MAATYDTELPTNKDHVRFLIGDTDTTSALLSDEEITAVLSEETATGQSLKYFAAARCLEALLAKWSGKGQGVREKQVSKLRIRYGSEESAIQAAERRISELRKRGSWLLRSSSKVFKVI